jgi:hypothetical protein
MSRASALGLAAMVLLASVVAGAADADRTLHHCVPIDDPDERLACYDQASGRAAAAKLPRQGGANAARDDVVPAEEFGLSELQRRARDPDRAQESRIESIEGTVQSLAYRPTGERIITLDNGQVWLQTEVTVRGPLHEGDAVVIRRAALGSYQLVTPGRVALRVRRIE